MNKKEFEEMQIEFAEFVYKYKVFIKSGYLFDLKYNRRFFKFLVECQELEIKISLMKQAIDLAAEGNNRDEIFENLVKALEKLPEEKAKFLKKNDYANQIMELNDKLTDENIKEFENIYYQYIFDYHPFVRVALPESVKPIIDLLDRFYYENNKGAFVEMLELNKKTLTALPIQEEHYNQVSQFYYELRKKINSEYHQRAKNYPYDRLNLFDDEMTVAREEGDILLKISNYKKVFDEMLKDFVNLFGKDFPN